MPCAFRHVNSCDSDSALRRVRTELGGGGALSLHAVELDLTRSSVAKPPALLAPALESRRAPPLTPQAGGFEATAPAVGP